jgi:hypothetical protein
MAFFSQGTRVDFPELAAIRKQLAERFKPNIRAKFLGAAIRKATKPVAQKLKAETRSTFKRVSGNLLRSVTTVVRKYPKSGNAVGIVGFTKAGTGKRIPTKGSIQKGKDRAFHAGLLIFGTKNRRTKGSIASSYNTRGPFRIRKRTKRGKYAGSTRVRTVPKSPRAFFKKAGRGLFGGQKKVKLGRIYPNDVLLKTYKKNKGMIRRALREEMTDIVERAARFLEVKFPPKNT